MTQIFRLDKFAEVGSGNSAPQKEELFKGGTLPFVRTSDVGTIHVGSIETSRDLLTPEGAKGLKLQPSGTILFPKSGASTFLNHRVVLSKNAYVSSHLATIKANNKLALDRYLFYFLQTIDARDLCQDQSYPSLNRDQIAGIEVPLPSLERQHEIVTKLDNAFAEIEKIRLNFFEQIDENLSLLSHAIRNLLHDPNVECRNTTLDHICENLDNKRIPITRDVRTSGDYPYYGASGIIDYVEDYIFEGDALLVSEDGANLLARSTPIAFSVSGKYWVNNHAHILKFADQELQKYVEYLLENTKLDDFITGAAQPKLTQRALNTIPIRIPVKGSDIKRLVAVISSLKELSLSVSENLKLILKLAEELQSALLSDYFTQEEAVA